MHLPLPEAGLQDGGRKSLGVGVSGPGTHVHFVLSEASHGVIKLSVGNVSGVNRGDLRGCEAESRRCAQGARHGDMRGQPATTGDASAGT